MKKIYCSLLFCCAIISINAQWASNTSENTLVANANAADIQTANTNDGRTWIAFYSQRGNNYDMRAQLLDAGGNRLLGDSGVLVSNKKSGSATFVFNVCIDADNNLIVAFQFQKGSSYEIIIQKVNTSGKLKWGNGIDLGPGLSPYPVTLSNNAIAVAWNNDNKIDYQKISSSGPVAWTGYKEFAESGVSRPQLIANTDTGFSMVYQSLVAFPFYTNLYEQRFDKSGAALWNNPSQVSTLTTASYRYFDVQVDNDTTYVGYYGNPSASNRFDACVQKINPNGTVKWGRNGSAFAADYSGNNDPSEQTIYIAKSKISNDVWAVCTITNSLQTTSGVFVQKFDGHTGSNYFGGKAKTVLPINSRLTSLAFSKLSLCDDSPLFLVTDNSNKLVAIKLKSDGSNAWDNLIRPVGLSNNTKFRYGFTDVYKGQAVAVWQEDKGSGDMPYAQNINCDGSTGSSLQTATKDENKVAAIAIKNIYPNPVQNALTATIASSLKTNTRICITDVSGNVLKQFQHNLNKGDNVIQLNVAGIKPGSCFIKVMNDKGSASTMFNKQ